MKINKFFQFVHIDAYSATPKYSQLINSILSAIETGKLIKGSVLPSINELSIELEISRDTAEKGYKYLKQIGVITSVPSKGYYIANTDFKQKIRVMLLFNKLSAHKKIIYDAFVEALGEKVAIDLYIYNNDFSLFKRLINNPREDYSHYVIIPHFIEGGENASEIIDKISKDKLILLDKKIPGITGEYGAAYENFEEDIFNALKEAKDLLSKYQTMKLIFPEKSYYPKEIVNGFRKFCFQYGFTPRVISSIDNETIEAGCTYINVMEDDLVVLIEKIKDLNLEIGKEVGIISYNETALKRIILNGITTISTDFYQMGKIAAQLILDNSQKHLQVPFNIKIRPSI